MTPKATCIGLSSDGRTNRWRISCRCGHQFVPQTTMRSTQTVTCPKCGTQMLADYNNDTISVLSLPCGVED